MGTPRRTHRSVHRAVRRAQAGLPARRTVAGSAVQISASASTCAGRLPLFSDRSASRSARAGTASGWRAVLAKAPAPWRSPLLVAAVRPSDQKRRERLIDLARQELFSPGRIAVWRALGCGAATAARYGRSPRDSSVKRSMCPSRRGHALVDASIRTSSRTPCPARATRPADGGEQRIADRCEHLEPHEGCASPPIAGLRHRVRPQRGPQRIAVPASLPAGARPPRSPLLVAAGRRIDQQQREPPIKGRNGTASRRPSPRPPAHRSSSPPGRPIRPDTREFPTVPRHARAVVESP